MKKVNQKYTTITLTPDQKDLFKATATSTEARQLFAKFIGEALLKSAPQKGIVRQLLEIVEMTEPGVIRMETDTNDVMAYLVAPDGTVEQQKLISDELYIPVYDIAAGAYHSRKDAFESRFNTVQNLINKLDYGMVMREEIQGWKAIRAAVNNAYVNGNTDQKVEIANGTTGTGVFSKQLLSAMLAYFENLGRTMTTVVGPPKMMEDIRGWATTEIDDATGREIITGGGLKQIWGVSLVTLPVTRWFPTIADKKSGPSAAQTVNMLLDATDTVDSGANVWSGGDITQIAADTLQVCYGFEELSVGKFVIKQYPTVEEDITAYLKDENGYIARESVGIAVTEPYDIVMGIVDRTSTEGA